MQGNIGNKAEEIQKIKNRFNDENSMLVCKDNQSIYQYVNEKFARIYGLNHSNDMVGMLDYDIPGGVSEFADIFIEQDNQVMESRKTIRILDIHPTSDGSWMAWINKKSPWFDEQNNLIGTVFNAVDITDAYSVAISSQLARFSGNIQNSVTITDESHQPNQNIHLSQRQKEVLFLTIRGKTSKLTGAVLNISNKTVEKHLEALWVKFGVHNRSELIDAAMSAGYLNQIPLSLFSKQLSVVLASD